jgi:23S rRNA pseudouridine1911/1915/1917 synthase
MASSTEDGWLAPASNGGWIYRDRVWAAADGIAPFYAAHHPHSSLAVWRARLSAGEIHRNGVRLWGEMPLLVGDHLAWHRPPWREEAVPSQWRVVHDDGDLHVIDKPAGLPVLPAGGWLEHTVLRLMERRHRSDPAGIPRPVHRLGRFTSGLLVCARQPATRRWLSAWLRESTAAAVGSPTTELPCTKAYTALVEGDSLPAALGLGESLTIQTPIGRQPHPRLGTIWCAVHGDQPDALAARSTLTLRERGRGGDLVEVAIATGRPHQVRIHCAAIGAPLRGDPLYGPGGWARGDSLPGEGGYRLRAQRLSIPRPDGALLRLTVEG